MSTDFDSIQDALMWMPFIHGDEFPGLSSPSPILFVAYNSAVQALKDRQWQEAREGFEALLFAHPKAPLLRAGMSLIRIYGDGDLSALDDLRAAAERVPDHLLTYPYAISLALSTDPPDYARAVPLFESVTRDQPDWAAAWYLLGGTLMGAARLAEAEAAFTRALDLQPDDIEYLIERARCRARQEKFEEAVADFEQCLTIEPTYLRAYAYYALALIDMEDQNGRLALGRRAVEAVPGTSFAYQLLADACLDNKLPREALKAADDAERIGAVPEMVETIRERAEAQLRGMEK